MVVLVASIVLVFKQSSGSCQAIKILQILGCVGDFNDQHLSLFKTKRNSKQSKKNAEISRLQKVFLTNLTLFEAVGSSPYTLAKTEIIYPKNVGTLLAMNFT